MKDPMDCAGAEELFSDYREGALHGLLRRDLEDHLASCAGCRELLEALEDVMSAFAGADDLEPPEGLAERAAAAALAWRRSVPPVAALSPPRRLPAWIQTLAAALALAATGAVFAARVAATELRRAPARIAERTVNAGVYLLERKDRLVEDLRILRVLIPTTFEGRVDRVNDRVDDYRRLLERRHHAAPEKKESQTGAEGLLRAEDFRTPTSSDS